MENMSRLTPSLDLKVTLSRYLLGWSEADPGVVWDFNESLGPALVCMGLPVTDSYVVCRCHQQIASQLLCGLVKLEDLNTPSNKQLEAGRIVKN